MKADLGNLIISNDAHTFRCIIIDSNLHHRVKIFGNNTSNIFLFFQFILCCIQESRRTVSVRLSVYLTRDNHQTVCHFFRLLQTLEHECCSCQLHRTQLPLQTWNVLFLLVFYFHPTIFFELFLCHLNTASFKHCAIFKWRSVKWMSSV